MKSQHFYERISSYFPHQSHDLKPDSIVEPAGEPPDPVKIERPATAPEGKEPDDLLPAVYQKMNNLPAVRPATEGEHLPVEAKRPGALAVIDKFPSGREQSEPEKKNRAEPPRRFAARFRDRLEKLLGSQ